MIKRTPQEIADMLKAYVAQDQAGAWYAYNSMPRRDSRSWYDSADASIGLDVSHMIETPVDHDWTVLYSPNYGNEPHADNKGEAYYADQPESDNKHQYEVHTQKEYKVVCYTYENSLNEAITSMMSEGWKPQGSIAMVYLGEIYSPPIMFAQAMVRGV